MANKLKLYKVGGMVKVILTDADDEQIGETKRYDRQGTRTNIEGPFADGSIELSIGSDKMQVEDVTDIYFEDDAVADETELDTKLATLFPDAGSDAPTLEEVRTEDNNIVGPIDYGGQVITVTDNESAATALQVGANVLVLDGDVTEDFALDDDVPGTYYLREGGIEKLVASKSAIDYDVTNSGKTTITFTGLKVIDAGTIDAIDSIVRREMVGNNLITSQEVDRRIGVEPLEYVATFTKVTDINPVVAYSSSTLSGSITLVDAGGLLFNVVSSQNDFATASKVLVDGFIQSDDGATVALFGWQVNSATEIHLIPLNPPSTLGGSGFYCWIKITVYP